MNHLKSHGKALGIVVLTLVAILLFFQNCGDNMPGPIGRALREDPVLVEGGATNNTGMGSSEPVGVVESEPPVIDPEIPPEPPEPTPVVEGAPNAPQNLRALLIGNNWSELQWDDMTDQQGQTIEYFILYRDGFPIRTVTRRYTEQ